jgi:predicted dehydrogenase
VFGNLTTGRGYYFHDCKSLGRNADGSLTWRGELWNSMLGGRNAAVHTSLPLLKCFGERVAEVFAYGIGAHTAPEYKMHDRVTIVARLGSGRLLEFVTDILSFHPHVFGYQLQGTRGCWEFDRAYLVENGKLTKPKTVSELEDEYALTEVIPDIGEPGGHGLSWEGIIRRFIRCIDRDERPPEDLGDALEMTAIGWAAEESLATGRTVKVMSFD